MINKILIATRAAFLMILLVIGLPCIVTADDSLHKLPAATKNDQLFKTLCIGEKSTGFNWNNNEWQFTRFEPATYLVEKLKINTGQRTLLCLSEANEKARYESADSALDWGCYGVREGERGLGPSHLAQLCLEDWKTINGKLEIQSISCETGDKIHFKPDGNFSAIQWGGGSVELSENSSYKDSLSITVGRCSIIQ